MQYKKPWVTPVSREFQPPDFSEQRLSPQLRSFTEIFPCYAPNPQRLEQALPFVKEMEAQGYEVDPYLASVLLGFGSYLQRVVRRHPELLSGKNLELLFAGEKALLSMMKVDPQESPVRTRLRDARNRTVALLVVGSVLKILPPEEVFRLYSLGAEGWIETAALVAYKELAERYPPPIREDEQFASYCVLACGKLGSRELNLSSDVDLIFVVEESREKTPILSQGGISPQEFWERWARATMELLQGVEPEGFVLRVDVRLRPGGNQSPLVIPQNQFVEYYRHYSTALERLALIRARPVAGSKELGEKILSELDPIIYPRYLDFEVLEDIRWLKEKIDREASRARRKGTDIKVGPGGIRELEFLLHALAMVYGGKHPALKTPHTLSLIENLKGLGILKPTTALDLRRAYLFLRALEDLLQAREDRQTHTLPEDQEELREIIRALGYIGESGESRFFEDLQAYRERVETEFRHLIHDPSSKKEAIRPEIMDLIEGEEDGGEEKLRLLSQTAFAHPQDAIHHLRRLLTGPRPNIYGARTRAQFERVLPFLLKEVSASEDPDQALRFLREFVDRIGGRSYIYALLRENPEVARALIRLFAISEFLGKYLTQHPELMDTLLLRSYATPHRSPGETQKELTRIVEAQPHPWAAAEELRVFQSQEILRIALNDLYQTITPLEVMEQLTHLARGIVKTLLPLSRALLKNPPREQLFPIALGKLGSGEMMYGSDLDLIFVIAPESEEGIEPYVPWAQKLITLLSTRTSRGTLYSVDMRLRPSGNQGLLVSTFKAFEEYHRRHASIWERIALVYHTLVHPQPSPQLSHFLLKACYGAGLSRADLETMSQIRRKMEEERGRVEPLKAAPGGVADIEIGLALLALWGVSKQRIAPTSSPWELLRSLENETPELAEALAFWRQGLWFYRVIMNRLRLITGRPLSTWPRDPQIYRKCARSLSLKEDELKDLAQQIPLKVRSAYHEALRFLCSRTR